jgi:hypothetical protein
MKVKRKASNGRIQVSKHYFLDQFWSIEAPHPILIPNIFKLAALVEKAAALRKEIPKISRAYVPLDWQETVLAEFGDMTCEEAVTAGLIDLQHAACEIAIVVFESTGEILVIELP